MVGSFGVKACNDDEFMKLFDQVGATKSAQILGITERNVYKRLRNLEKHQSPSPRRRKSGHLILAACRSSSKTGPSW